jgi:hypothetical protein
MHFKRAVFHNERIGMPIKTIPRSFVYVLLLLVLAGCSGTTSSPTAVPSPPLEIPSAMAFPKSLAVDVVPASLAEAMPDVAKSIALDGEYTPYIFTTAQMYIQANAFVDQMLTPLATVEIPVSPTLTSYTVENVVTATATFQKIVFVFSDFDLDGDGNKEGCTGCTCPVGCAPDLGACPTEATLEELKSVCFRVWLLGMDTLNPRSTGTIATAGKFDKMLPTPDDPDTPAYDANNGAGEFRFRMQIESPESQRNLLIKVPFNHNDPSHPSDRWSDLQILETSTGADAYSRTMHAYSEVIEEAEPAGDTYLRTLVNMDQTLSSLSAPVDLMGQYRADQDFWSLRASMPAEAAADANLPQAVLDDTCVRFSTGSAVADDICIDLGIFTDPLEFLLPPVESGMTFPADYPEEPPIEGV